MWIGFQLHCVQRFLMTVETAGRIKSYRAGRCSSHSKWSHRGKHPVLNSNSRTYHLALRNGRQGALRGPPALV